LLESLRAEAGHIRLRTVKRWRRDRADGVALEANAEETSLLIAIIDTFVDVASHGGMLTPAGREPISRRELDRRGVALSTAIRAVHLVAEETWSTVNTLARGLGSPQTSPDTLEFVGRWLLALAGELCDALTEGAEGVDSGTSRQTGVRPPTLTLEELVRDQTSEAAALGERAHELGLAEQSAYALVLAFSDKSTIERGVLESATQGVSRASRGAVHTGLLRGPVPHTLILIPVRSTAKWREAITGSVEPTGALVRFLASSPVERLEAVAPTYRSLRSLLPIARALHPEGSVDWASDLEVYRLLQGLSVDDRLRFVDAVIGPIRGGSGRRQPLDLATLDALVSGAPLVEIARRTSVHPKTVQYRLRKIREVTGLDPAVPSDGFRLQLAVRLAQLSLTVHEGGLLCPSEP
jgi:hypothetical protein